MNYPEFIKYLKSKNIILFDHDYRIAYNNINSYMIESQVINSSMNNPSMNNPSMNNPSRNMIGGGTRLLHYNDTELKNIIDTALSPDPRKLYWFVN